MSNLLKALQNEAAARAADESEAKREMVRLSYSTDKLAYKAARAKWEMRLNVAMAADERARIQYEAENGK